MRTGKLISMIGAALLVAACGGEKKKDRLPNVTVAYSGPQTSASISGSNVGAFAAAATGATQGVAGATSEHAGFGVFAALAGTKASPGIGILQAMKYAAAYRGDAALASAASQLSFTGPCPGGGTETISFYDPDGIPTVTDAGTAFGVSFDECTDEYGVSNDGGFTLTITSAPAGGDAFDPTSGGSGTVTFGFQLRFSNLVTWAPDQTFSGLNGDVSYDFAVDGTAMQQRFTISGQSLAGVEGVGGAVQHAFRLTGRSGAGSSYSETFTVAYADAYLDSVDATSWGFDGRMCSSEMAGCLDLLIDPPFWQLASEAYPYSGTLRIDADNGAYIQIEATDGATGAINVSYDVDGPGGVDPAGIYATTWGCLETATDSTTCF
ncbi:MAG TPA: hypothetical protein VF894_03570 [Anaeromyxobacter sp.]